MKRVLLIVGLTLGAVVASAQSPAPAPSPAAKTPSPGEQCLGKEPLYMQHIADLRDSRDSLERTVSSLRVQVQKLQTALDAVKATKKD